MASLFSHNFDVLLQYLAAGTRRYKSATCTIRKEKQASLTSATLKQELNKQYETIQRIQFGGSPVTKVTVTHVQILGGGRWRRRRRGLATRLAVYFKKRLTLL